MIEIPIKLLSSDAKIPTKAHEIDAGFDLYSVQNIDIVSGQIAKIQTGITVNIPPGYVGLIQDKSSVGSKGLKVFGGVIDAGYTGEIIVCLGNMTSCVQYYHEKLGGQEPIKSQYLETTLNIIKGQKIAQLVIVPLPRVKFVQVDSLEQTERSDKGFGSSGQ